jgi:hypothetical protein
VNPTAGPGALLRWTSHLLSTDPRIAGPSFLACKPLGKRRTESATCRTSAERGSLFNSKYESLPSLLGPENESVYDQRKGAERVVIPPNMRPMCKQQYAPMKFQNDQVITFNPDKYDARKSIVP